MHKTDQREKGVGSCMKVLPTPVAYSACLLHRIGLVRLFDVRLSSFRSSVIMMKMQDFKIRVLLRSLFR